jgi:hypothetical protein
MAPFFQFAAATNDNDHKKKESFEKKIRNMGRGAG